ncbi:MAG: T9SS type A sorting domain-containing protein [Bacteroidetes bacterium]|nr:T9SS type A sorting domain-containing protein [Bacteroidota bacterium]
MRKITTILFGLTAFLSFAQPANDACANAIQLTMQPLGQPCTPTTYSNLNSTSEAPLVDCIGESILSVWFKFTTGPTQTVANIRIANITTDFIAADIFMNCLGSPAAGLSENCLYSFSNINAKITGFLPSTTYYLRVGNVDQITVQGDFSVCVSNYVVPPAPVNDICSAATILPIQSANQDCTPATFTNESATVSEVFQPSCEQEDMRSVWFKFTPGAGQTSLRFTINNVDTDVIIGDLFTNCSGTEATGLTSSCFLAFENSTKIINGFSPSTTYFLRLGNSEVNGSYAGEFQLCVKEYIVPPAPVNNSCTEAIVLQYNIETSFDTEGATTDNILVDNGTELYKDVWFTFIPSKTEVFEVTTCGSDYDTKLAVYQANDCSSIMDDSEIAYNDDNQFCAPSNYNSFLQFNGIAGSKYYIRVGGYDQDHYGPTKLRITSGSASISEKSIVPFDMYPNPANDQVTFNFTSPEMRIIKIIDLSGKQIETITLSEESWTVNIVDLKAGVYFVKVLSKTGETVKRLVKQ